MSDTYELRGELVLSEGLGAFWISVTGTLSITVLGSEFTILKAERSWEDLAGVKSTGEVIISLDPSYRKELLKLTLEMISSQIGRYDSSHFEPLIEQVIKEDEKHRLEHGAVLMHNEAKTVFTEICASLLTTYDRDWEKS